MLNIGVELELAELIILQTILTALYVRFEVETSFLRKIFKWFVIYGLTIAAYYWIGHWAIFIPWVPVVAGSIFHFIWCRRNSIHPFKATPRRRYYELRGWQWEE